MDNPDRLPDEQHRHFMRLIYDKYAMLSPFIRNISFRCLCCFRLHPEVWLSIARYELSVLNGVVQARLVLKEALTTLPQVIFVYVLI
jgi:hypothetical protein